MAANPLNRVYHGGDRERHDAFQWGRRQRYAVTESASIRVE